jgi:hypothetical protein
MRCKCALAGMLLALTVATKAAAEFTPPADGKLKEKQLANYIDVKKDQYSAMQSASNAAEGTQSSAAGLAIYANMSNKMDAAITNHGMTKEEFTWVDGVVGKLWYIAMWQQQWEDTGKPDLEKQIKAKEADRDDAKSSLAQYEQAQKDGKRVMTKDQRDTELQSATADRDTAAEEVKSHEGEVKQIKEEIAGHDKDAADADALAKTPPADIAADDRQTYIDQKKTDSQTARDASKEATDRLKDAQKNLDDSKAKVTALNGQIDHPEIPVSDDDKAQVKQQNDQAIADAKSKIDSDEQGIGALKEALAGGPPMLATLLQDPKEKPDPDNLALVKKHIKEYLAAIGNSKMLEAK